MPDLLDFNLNIIFCGMAASKKSKQVNAYYAGPGNKFWKTLYNVGLTSKELKPREFKQLITYKIGLTDICKTDFGNDNELDTSKYDVDGFNLKILEYESYVHLAAKRIMTMMMLIDGEIDEEEKNTIKAFMEAITGDTLSDVELDEEIQFCKDNPDNPEDFLKTMFPYMNKEGGELVYKCCYHVSLADGELHSNEEKMLKRVAEILQLSSAHVKGIMAEINES